MALRTKFSGEWYQTLALGESQQVSVQGNRVNFSYDTGIANGFTIFPRICPAVVPSNEMTIGKVGH